MARIVFLIPLLAAFLASFGGVQAQETSKSTSIAAAKTGKVAELPFATPNGDWFFARVELDDLQEITLRYDYRFCSRSKPIEKTLKLNAEAVAGKLFDKSGRRIECKEMAYLWMAAKEIKPVIVLKNLSKIEQVIKLDGNQAFILLWTDGNPKDKN